MSGPKDNSEKKVILPRAKTTDKKLQFYEMN